MTSFDRRLDEWMENPAFAEAYQRSRTALAETIHALCPHGQLYAFSECPQRHHDEREAEETMAGLERRGFRVSEAISE